MSMSNAVVTCEIKLFRHYFSLCRRPSESFYFSAWKLAWNHFEIISEIVATREYFPTRSTYTL